MNYKNKFKKISALTIILILSFSVSVFASPSYYNPAIYIYTPEENTVDPVLKDGQTIDQIFNSLDTDLSDDEQYSLYRKSLGKKPAPYSFVAHGDNEDWTDMTLTNADGSLTLAGIVKVEEGSIDDGSYDLPGDNNFEDFFKISPDQFIGATQGYWHIKDDSGAEEWLTGLYDNGKSLYFSIKAATDKKDPDKLGGFNLFIMNDHWYEKMQQAVTWSTLQEFLVLWGGGSDLGLGGSDISHLSFWIGDTISSVPEPATMMLFGFGLIGLAGAVRKTKKS